MGVSKTAQVDFITKYPFSPEMLAVLEIPPESLIPAPVVNKSAGICTPEFIYPDSCSGFAAV
jgi:hypothetical protein